MRLIDADALINRIVFHKDWSSDEKEAFEDVINEEPSVEPRQKAHWINVRGGNIADCGMCNARGRAWMNFCPICGADMRGEQNG